MGILRGIDWLLSLDVRFELYLNQFVGRYPWFDSTITNTPRFHTVEQRGGGFLSLAGAF